MNHIKITLLALATGLTATLSGCQSEKDTLANPSESSGVALQVNTASILGGKTRGQVVEGESLPEECRFVMHALDKDTVNYIPTGQVAFVIHAGNENIFEYPNGGILLPSENEEVSVLAFYPEGYSDNVDFAWLNTLSREDFMWGTAVDNEGQPMYASEENPAVNILFEHILARITLRIKRGENNQDDYKFTNFTLSGDFENSYRTASANLRTRTIENFDYSDFKDIQGIWDKYYFNGDPEDVVTVDFLVLPTKTSWVFGMTYDFSDYRLGTVLPETDYQSGNQYIYNVTIDKDESGKVYLSIADAYITLWQNNTMPDINVEIE